ncbi:MAG: mechanosensitive ion channel family protein [bacterium]
MEISLKQMFISVSIALLTSAVLFIVRGSAFRFLHRGAEKTKINDIIIKSLKTPSIYWCIAIGLYLGLAISELPERYLFYLAKTINVLVILSITIATANLMDKVFRVYVQQLALPIPTTGIAYGILKGTILVIGFLIILTTLGISIAPLIAALGVGSLAIALANLFAGIYILIEKPIRVGDFVGFETGQNGYVEDITWRTTRIRTPSNNMVIIPNSKITQNLLTNYYLPEKRMSLLIPISVSYSSDPEKVERILIEEAKKAVSEIPGLLGEPESLVRFIPGFGESSLDFTLICQVKEFVDQYPVQHELRKKIFRRFKEEGIKIPFPHRTVYLRKEKEE